MTTGVMLPISVVTQYFTTQGAVLNGGTINTYAAGTTTPINTYTDSTLGTSNGASLTLDAYGRTTQEMWVATGTSVKVIIKDSLGNQQGPTLDNLVGLNELPAGASGNGPFWGGSAGGTANALTLTFSNGPLSYTSGLRITFLATANSTSSVSVNVNGLGIKAIQNNTASLVGGEIANGSLYEIEYTGTAFQLAAMVGDPVEIKGTQTVTGAKTFSGATTLSGATTISGTTTISGASTFSALVTLSGGAVITPETTPATNEVGYLGTPVTTQNTAYTLAMSDAGKTVYHDETTARTWTIPANSSIAFPVGTTIVLDNTGNSAGTPGAITLAITTDTLRRADGVAGTGSRTIPANSVATIKKNKSTEWVILGVFT